MSSTDPQPPSGLNGEGDFIRVRGARVHNLQNVSLDIPRDQLVVITGPSGSGKSSLAFDTLFAEGQRQYIESLSVYARQFLHQLERPDVDLIEGLQPTISIDQRAGSRNPRSTVATVTEIYDHLRLLMARVGEVFCYRCGAAICQQTQEQIVETLLALAEGTKAILLAPMVRGRKGQHGEVFEAIRKAGFVRARVDGEVYDLDALPALAPRKNHTIEAVVDRLVLRDSVRPRLAESIQLALGHGDGLVAVTYLLPGASSENGWRESLYSTEHACAQCQISYEELEPRTFSFNSPYGACPACDGLGSQMAFDPDLVAPDLSLSLARGAVAPWRNSTPAAAERHRQLLGEFGSNGSRPSTPLEKWKPKDLNALFAGDRDFPGLLVLLEREYEAAKTDAARERLDAFRSEQVCPACQGARLRPEARSVRVAGKAIHEITALPVETAREFFAGLEFPERQAPVAKPIVKEISTRLDFLVQVGLDYLSLDRPADTLSGGELQRIRLATGIGSGLVGVCYILDEPSIGLHPRDNGRLIQALRNLQHQGNSVLVVEHDEAIMREADYLIDVGPGAGRHGGEIVAQGLPAEVRDAAGSITGQYLSGRMSIPTPAKRRHASQRKAIAIEGAAANNLKELSVSFPLGALVCVTGVSGSGKSSLVQETLARAVARRLGGAGAKPGPHASLRGVSQIDKLVEIDQSPIGRTPRSNPATYTGLFDEIRQVYATTREARLRGYKSGRFSFNVKGGRCEECQGQGVRKIEMNFLPDLYVACPECQGARFNRATLEIQYKGKSIAEVLDLSVDEAAEFFENFPAIRRLLESLREVGLGYLSLGQSSTTLSGGEAQRIKLAAELGRSDTGKTLYILDEPTTGLHFDDVRKLLVVLNRLVDLGNTVVVIEHQLDVIKSADWLIDLGPEGGAAGGRLLAAGTPEEIAALADNATGQYLKPLLNGAIAPAKSLR
ncbi:MAG TPA: excinuclease ABC subunit UvrA [Pirellulales bacterium]|nr:excinuclease ABC subunit UvrA [Pirellulales bacterium]